MARAWVPAERGTPRRRDAAEDGARYGALCLLRSDGPIMLLMFGVGKGSPVVMAILALAMVAERHGEPHRSAHWGIGAVALASGAAMVLWGAV